jgi:hypothetical protein
MSRHQAMCLKFEYTKSVEYEAKFEYAEVIATKRNNLQETIKKNKLNSENACYHYIQNLSSFHPLSTNTRLKIHTSIRFSVLLYRYETVHLATMKGRRLCAVERKWI